MKQFALTDLRRYNATTGNLLKSQLQPLKSVSTIASCLLSDKDIHPPDDQNIFSLGIRKIWVTILLGRVKVIHPVGISGRNPRS